MPLKILSHPAALLAVALAAAAATVAPKNAQAQAFLRLTKPPAPEGSARTLAMGNAVVALGGDAGAVVVNPATIVSAPIEGGDDLTIGGGDRGMSLFACHVYGNRSDQVPGAVWMAVMNGPLAHETAFAYTAAASTRTGLDIGTTLRYEQWERLGASGHLINGDFGMRYAWQQTVQLGVSLLNLGHGDPFRGAASYPSDTQAIAGVSFTGIPDASLELDYVYTQHHRYGRFGGEYQLPGGIAVRGGLSDRDYSLGVGAKRGAVTGSLSMVVVDREHPLYSAGFSSRF